MTVQIKSLFLAAAATLAVGSPAARAASMETVVVIGELQTDAVSGTKTDTPILETPQSVNVLTADQIRDWGSQSVQEVLRYAPGVDSETRGTMTALDYFYARGFSMDQYLNGLKTASGGYSSPQPDPYLLQSVEVLRGPASILYGQASPGGVVNLVSKKAGVDPVNEVEIMGGNFGHIQGAADFSGDLTSDGSLSWRLTGLAKSADAQVDFVKERRYAVAPSLTWRPDADTRLTVLASYQDDPDLGYYNWTPAYGTVLSNPYGKLATSFYSGDPDFDRFSQKNTILGYEFEHRFNDTFSVRQNFRYANSASQFRNLFASYLNTTPPDPDDPDAGPDTSYRELFRYAWATDEAATNVDLDTQVVAHFAVGDAVNIALVGVDYQYLRFGQKLGYNFTDVPSLFIFAPVYHIGAIDTPIASDDVQHSHQTGLYAQDQLSFGNLRVLVGGRQDWVTATDTQYINDLGLPQPGVETSQNQSAFTGRVGALYLFDIGLAPYASYTESFQPQSGLDEDGNALKPTRGRQYEVGIKYQPTGTQSFVTLALYNLKQNNVTASDSNNPGLTGQIGAVTSRGIDIWGQVALTDDLDINASYSYVDQKVTAGDIDFGPPLGAHPSDIPVDQATLWADWRVPVTELEGLGLGLGVRYMGRSYGADDNSFKVPAHTVIDGLIHYDLPSSDSPWSDMRLAFNVTNLFDNIYVAGCSGYDYCAYGFRRTLQFSVSKRF